jgi:hypothetical protein
MIIDPRDITNNKCYKQHYAHTFGQLEEMDLPKCIQEETDHLNRPNLLKNLVLFLFWLRQGLTVQLRQS